MNRRPDQKQPSIVSVIFRVTPEEREEWKALARYLKVSLSDLMRRLQREERTRLLADGRKPPRK